MCIETGIFLFTCTSTVSSMLKRKQLNKKTARRPPARLPGGSAPQMPRWLRRPRPPIPRPPNPLTPHPPGPP